MSTEEIELTEEDRKILHYIQIFDLKEKLLTCDTAELLEIYQDEEGFINFVDSLDYLLQEDEDFLKFLPLFIEDIESVLMAKRFSLKDSELIKKINNIICRINILKGISEDEQMQNAIKYIDKEYKLRGNDLESAEVLTKAMIADVDVVLALLDEDVSKLDDDIFFLASTNYFMNLIPELYDEDLVRISLDKCKRIAKKSKLFDKKTKTYVKKTEERLLNL